ncbi:hypothetical protein [Halorussus salinisoli]|uniref:hypothetical protein n=1 Tax=Halorussus salinisoli TaxID=2558242 RepID=UPI0010C20CB6|nr:hypothetical protein [Halorussus salinisoli]
MEIRISDYEFVQTPTVFLLSTPPIQSSYGRKDDSFDNRPKAHAIGDIIGGNVFDTLMIALGDLAYSAAPIYGDVSPEVVFLTGIAILMNSVLMIMLIRRETEDLGTDIGTESYLILAIYISGVIFLLA